MVFKEAACDASRENHPPLFARTLILVAAPSSAKMQKRFMDTLHRKNVRKVIKKKNIKVNILFFSTYIYRGYAYR